MKYEHETESEFVGHEPCPKCNSEDNLARYSDGHGWCFGCGYYEPSDDEQDARQPDEATTEDGVLLTGAVKPLPTRSLNENTCRKFGYSVGRDRSNKPCQIADYRNEKGELQCQKLRYKDKAFKLIGDTKNPPLFGMHLWKRGGRKIVITEGEIDALSVSQAQGNKWPVVSLPNGAQSAKKVLSNHLEYLESFEQVILMFDMDEPGQKAVDDCVPLFSPTKVRVAKLEGGKDANDLLKAGNVKGIIDAIWQARHYQPDGVLMASDLKEAINKPAEWGLSYPWPSVTQATFGIRSREIITLGAGTGMGKTDFYKEIATHLIMEHKQNVGMLFLEEAPKETMLGVMGKYASIPFHIPDTEYTQEQKDEAFDAISNGDRLFLYDSFGYTDYEIIRHRIRYMVVACGCKYIFLDHITALVSSSEVEDERRALDSIMTNLASLVRELDFTLFMISHLATPQGTPHEEGGRVLIKQFRGSRAIGQWSSYIFGLERNQQAEDDEERHTTTFRILKDRYTGRSTGFTQQFGYDEATGRVFEKEYNPFEEDAAGDGEF